MSEDSKFVAAIERVRTGLEVSYADELAGKLEELRRLSEEQEDERGWLSLDSLRRFVGFLKLAPPLECPTVTLAPEGNIFAECLGETKVTAFNLVFFPDGKVQGHIFLPSSD